MALIPTNADMANCDAIAVIIRTEDDLLNKDMSTKNVMPAVLQPETTHPLQHASQLPTKA